jgi:hypothetical protein
LNRKRKWDLLVLKHYAGYLAWFKCLWISCGSCVLGGGRTPGEVFPPIRLSAALRRIRAPTNPGVPAPAASRRATAPCRGIGLGWLIPAASGGRGCDTAPRPLTNVTQNGKTGKISRSGVTNVNSSVKFGFPGRRLPRNEIRGFWFGDFPLPLSPTLRMTRGLRRGDIVENFSNF